MLLWGRCGCDHMVVRFTTTCAISAYNCEFEPCSWGGVLYVIKFVNDLRQVGGFLRVLQVSSTNKTDCHDITEILLKVALSTQTKPECCYIEKGY
jgi:hypothetical protein